MLSDFAPVPGVIKDDYEDFAVEEIPLYPFSGDGTHAYFMVEKRGLSTMQAVSDIARALGVRRFEIGYAGLKDSRAVTRQWMSLEHVEPERIRALEIPRVQILEITRHTNKLRIGHLRGNRFDINVRRTQPGKLPALQDALETLARRGVPNYFGPQRFGGRGDSWQVGRAIVCANLEAAVDLILGQPGEEDHGDIRRARQLYERGEYAKAASLWPRMFRDERNALSALDRSGGKKKRAFLALDRFLRQFYVSAYQSHLFNQVVAQRLNLGLDRLLTGDLAWRHANGAVFEVLDSAIEQPRAEAFEISPSGPLFGYRMSQPAGAAGEAEAALLAGEGFTRESFHSRELRVKGGRRPLRFPIGEATIRLGADARGEYLALTFSLPRGCYATSLLRELFAEPPPAVDGDVEASEASDR
jgi:tRNA pseudouridine13 synthase